MDRPERGTTHWLGAATRSIPLQLLVGGFVVVGAADLGPQMRARLDGACRPGPTVDALRTPVLCVRRRLERQDRGVLSRIADRERRRRRPAGARRCGAPEAARAGVPGEIADAVAHVESDYRPTPSAPSARSRLDADTAANRPNARLRGSDAELAAPQDETFAMASPISPAPGAARMATHAAR